MRENGGLNFYRNLMKHEVTVDRNKTAPKCRLQYLAGHENSQVTMDVYAKAKYNRPEELSEVVNSALKLQADSDES